MILMCEDQEEEWCDCDFLDSYDPNNGELEKTIVDKDGESYIIWKPAEGDEEVHLDYG